MTDPTVLVRPMAAADWPDVEAIYREGIATGNATFEAAPPTWEAFDAGKLPEHRFVAADGDAVLGWVAVSPISARPVYRGVVEHSVYVAAAARGRGVGHLLLDALIASTEAAGIWTIQSGIFPENATSRALHARHGFRELGTRERVGLMTFGPWAGQWRDNVLVERRSPRVGC
ncbi:GNAT family N-acetyltransferase [Curtobacterium sp. ME26]|uniref:GNAT family N-acetyltransferase n=1 Tax=Curtobacterium sp. ME26 TaxID=2744254 RepID=UPI0015F73B65|nr:GNAT family N-acetyltransferase [Curtobacterium sp. ME26]